MFNASPEKYERNTPKLKSKMYNEPAMVINVCSTVQLVDNVKTKKE